MNWLTEPWPWWLSGILIGLTVPLMYLLAGQAFGISTSLKEIGALCGSKSRLDYLSKFDWRGHLWTIVFVVGIALGGLIGSQLLSSEPAELLPESANSTRGAITLFLGGILVGFGARYAGGCTSGHSITGISNLNLPSLIATVCFFLGGLAVVWCFGFKAF